MHANTRTPTADWLIDPRALSEKVMTARVLLPNDGTFAAVRIINLSDKEFRVNTGAVVGCARIARVLPGPTGTPPHATARARSATDRDNTRTRSGYRSSTEIEHLKPVVDALP